MLLGLCLISVALLDGGLAATATRAGGWAPGQQDVGRRTRSPIRWPATPIGHEPHV